MSSSAVLGICGPVSVIIVAIGIGAHTSDLANACVISKVVYMKDACPKGAVYTAAPIARTKVIKASISAPEPTVAPTAHKMACLEANYSYAPCEMGGTHHSRYQHPADDDGPWWTGASGW